MNITGVEEFKYFARLADFPSDGSVILDALRTLIEDNCYCPGGEEILDTLDSLNPSAPKYSEVVERLEAQAHDAIRGNEYGDRHRTIASNGVIFIVV